MALRIFKNSYASHASSEENQHKAVKKNGHTYVQVGTDTKKFSRCLAFIKAVALTYLAVYTGGLACISWRVRNGLVDNYKILNTGERRIDYFQLINSGSSKATGQSLSKKSASTSE